MAEAVTRAQVAPVLRLVNPRVRISTACAHLWKGIVQDTELSFEAAKAGAHIIAQRFEPFFKTLPARRQANLPFGRALRSLVETSFITLTSVY
jgi:hypothetical protein